MAGKTPKRDSKIRRLMAWCKSNWQVLLFWLVCAFAGWYLGVKGYGMALYFRLTGINPEEWTPLLRLTAQNDPKVGSIVSLEGLTDLEGKPMQLPFPNKFTGLLFVCSGCGLKETLAAFSAFQQRHKDKVQLVVVFVGGITSDTVEMLSVVPNAIWARDPKLAVFERLNALYMPRFYLIAQDGTLRYLSPLVGYFWQAERWHQELERLSKRLGE